MPKPIPPMILFALIPEPFYVPLSRAQGFRQSLTSPRMATRIVASFLATSPPPGFSDVEHVAQRQTLDLGRRPAERQRQV